MGAGFILPQSADGFRLQPPVARQCVSLASTLGSCRDRPGQWFSCRNALTTCKLKIATNPLAKVLRRRTAQENLREGSPHRPHPATPPMLLRSEGQRPVQEG